ncbi:hypothetical protein AGMMS50293_11920 [Spirochaetia bacterium]|nr:hypothetical protein AGMMS50293_11920 [Spirochaetia bacterium]
MTNIPIAEIILNKLKQLAVPMGKQEFSRKEYNRLFPRGAVETPIGKVKLGENQFEKLKAKKRMDLLGAMHQTLSDPVVIIAEEKDGKRARLYIKTFLDEGDSKTDHLMAVVAIIDDEAVVISTGKRRKGQIENKIKMAGSPLYLKGEEDGSPTRGTRAQAPLPGT